MSDYCSDTWEMFFLDTGLYAPAANLAPQWLQFQTPELTLFTDMWWQTGHSCLDFWVASIVLTLLRTMTPYLAPNLPAVPALFVLFDILITR
jgi:hypothetical protein